MRRLLSACATLLLLNGCASRPQQPAAETAVVGSSRYSALPGPNPVGVIPAGVLRDARRNKDLRLAIDYPTRVGPHPIIIFSHGFGASERGYVSLSSHWASHGYVVIRPMHADNAVQNQTRSTAELWVAQTPADWRNRVADIVLVLDSLQALQQQYPELEGKMDSAHIGVGGHSYGAFTAMLVGGVRTFAGSLPVSYADPRVKAVLAMSPQGVSQARGLTRESWTELRVPTLFLTGSEDRGAGEGEDAAWRRQAFEYSPNGEKWFINIEGANHFTFSGRPFNPAMVSPEPRQVPITTRDGRQIEPVRPRATYGERDSFLFARVQAITLAFWGAYLKKEAEGKEYLARLAERGGAVVETK